MNPNKFETVFNYIEKHYDSFKMNSVVTEYEGMYDNTRVKIKINHLENSKHIYMNGCEYFSTKYGKGIRML